jgi:hypothetical protein
MADRFERFIASYLRLNGYFTIPNFIVHAADDPKRISTGQVGNYTETDIIGVRMPYSREITGKLHIANDRLLTDGATGRIDVVVAEVKSGTDNKPNRVWRGAQRNEAITYLSRFIGLHKESDLSQVAESLATKFRYEDKRCRFRYIVFAPVANEHYKKLGVSYITLREAISFIVEVRGNCWINKNIGVASVHHQWDSLLVEIFDIANRVDQPTSDRVQAIESLLAINDQTA